MAHTWLATIEFTDHGAWDPADEAACAAIIAKVNEARLSTDARPCIRRAYWRDEPLYLNVEINGEEFSLDAGEHLVAAIMPDGRVYWSATGIETLVMFGRPA